jgi:hypothetical protein
MPLPLTDDSPGLVDMDGFCFTSSGLAHNLSRADWERLSVPTFSPQIPTTTPVRYDAALDRPGEKS